ncbi:hypothetical protein [Rhodococcus sp. SGAir0479]|uniref:hypothetical protein n=1 Tax=Rhodococcus sp. SGAir0479 TaxID=2567884 RepID=UPI0010CCC115|nr:hypothetical protein [Rhodococcus sp. SGAir0479]QCQ92493.1 hypothetical protein E7742_15550 [Rhodococcus sp. SGAir0479]
MNHPRIVRTVCFVTVGYLIVLAIWLGRLIERTPENTIPYQIGGLLAAYGSALGLGMMWADRPTRAERRLAKHGIEGWARIRHAQRIRRTVDNGELTELDLDLTVPGSQSYTGRVLYEVLPENRSRFAVGETISIRVDPRKRDRILICT